MKSSQKIKFKSILRLNDTLTILAFSNSYLYNISSDINECKIVPSYFGNLKKKLFAFKIFYLYKFLVGRIKVDTNLTSFELLNDYLKNLNIQLGGHYIPKECSPKYKVAIIIPYLNRNENLILLLKNLHPFLIKQKIEYSIFIIEPEQSLTVNRGLLINIGFLESLKLAQNRWDCFVFHDVDLLPENDKNFYHCPTLPKHLSSAVSTFNYK